jgi:hypothetical protein
MLIDRRCSAEILVTLEHQDPVPGPGKEGPGGQAAKAGADHDGVELPGHAQPSRSGPISSSRRRVDTIREQLSRLARALAGFIQREGVGRSQTHGALAPVALVSQ